MDPPALTRLLSRLHTFGPAYQQLPTLSPADVALMSRGFRDGFARRWDPPPFSASMADFNLYKAACIIGKLEASD